MRDSIDTLAILQLHKECIIDWYSSNIEHKYQGFYDLVKNNHYFNFKLWLAEDRARRKEDFEFVYLAKQEIDKCNQLRNNCMEAMDTWLFNRLNPAESNLCPVNSESPGMIIDRLSILSLKSYHMALQTKRKEVDEAHRKTCSEKLAIIQQQRDQLAQCFDVFLNEIQEKKRTFRIYHQFKMYNDPKLNPELY